MPNVPSDVVKSYVTALEWMSERFKGQLPSEYRIYYSSQFLPVLLRAEAIRITGSPMGLLSTPEERSLHQNSKIGISLAQPFLSIPGKGYFCSPERILDPLELTIYASQFVHLLGAFFLGETSLHEISAKNEQLHKMDHNLSSLLTRAINLSPSANRGWITQYFRDLAALIVRFSIISAHAFHEPVESESTPYAEFLRQLIPYARKRAGIWRSIPLYRAVLNGFICLCARKFQRERGSILSKSEGITGKLIADVLESSFSSFQDILDEFHCWKSDKSLIESIPLAKFTRAAQKATTSPESLNFVEYLQAVSELSLETNNDLWEFKFESDRYIGFLQGKEGPIYFYELSRTQIVPEQLLILHNHAKPLNDPCSLPSTASIVAFRKKERLGSLASYFQPEIFAETPQPKNPWDFPYYIDSVIASSAIGIGELEWEKFLTDTWISKEELEGIGLNDDQLACTLLLLKGKAAL